MNNSYISFGKLFTTLKTMCMQKFCSLTTIAVLALLCLSFNSNAQCETTEKYNLSELVSVTNKFEHQGGELWHLGYKSDKNVMLPIHYEWRKGSENGELIKSGTFTQFYSEKSTASDGLLKDLETGKYVLVAYDSSKKCKKEVRIFEIQ